MPPILCDSFADGSVARIRLNRPKGNILDREMVGAIRAELENLSNRRGLRLLVFEGVGAHFSFGASVEEHLPGTVEQMLPEFHALFRDLEALGVPTAAVVRGQCLGGGFELATWCGRVFAGPTATFAVPEVQLAVFPPMAALALSWRVSGAAATELVVTGHRLDAEEAVRIGVADLLAEDPLEACLLWFENRLSKLSPAGLSTAWRAVRAPLQRGLEQQLPELEALYFEGMTHPDSLEGLTAFLERRPPVWEHTS